MKKINLLGQASSGSSESTTITNLGLIYLKPLLDIEPTRETQELFPGDDGVSGYSFIRIKGVNESMQEKEVNPSTSKQVITPDASYLGLEQVTISAVDKNIDANIKSENIKSGVTILGVEGAYHPITKPIEITPSTDEQTEVPDMGVDGFDSVTVHAVTSDIDSNIKSENIIKGVSILGVEGTHDDNLYEYDDHTATGDLENQFVTKNIVQYGNYMQTLDITPPEGYSGFSKVTLYTKGVLNIDITPKTETQDFNLDPKDESYCGYNRIHVDAVDSTIDDNIKADNIKKGVSILGVEGTAELIKTQSKTVTYDTPGEYSITPDEGYSISKANVTVLEEALPDQLRYDLATRTDGTSSPTFKKEIGTDFTEDGDTYFLFCNAEGNPAKNLVGFSYCTSAVPYSYHHYDASYFKEKNGFIYLNVTKLGGYQNSTGVHIGYLFHNHKIPNKFLYNCAGFGGISIGAECRGVGEQACYYDKKYQDFKLRYFIARANNNAMAYGAAYSLYASMFNPAIYRSITIDSYVNTGGITYYNIDFNNTDNYHIYHQYSGSAQATDDTDSSYVDITVYKYKRILANYNITNQIIGVYSLSSNDTGLIWQYGTDVNSNYKIVVHDSKTYMYCTHAHDSSSGGLIWLMFKDDNQTIPDFGFYGIDNLQTIKIQKTVNLGCAAYFSDITQNKYKTSFTSLVPIKVHALSLFGFKNINLITNYYNYAAAYATNSLYVINVTGNYNSGDESQSINSKGLITVDLSGNYFPGNFTNSNYNNFSGPNEIRNVSYLEGSLTRKWMNNNLYDTVNYIDSNPGGNHLFELDLPEQPLLFGSQNLSLTKLGMTINGTKILPEWSKACYNLMISHNIGTFECTFGLDNIYNIVNKTINICIFCDPSKVTFNHSTDSPLSSDYVINIYTNDEYSDLDALKTMMSTNFSGITVNYDTFTVVYDTLQNQTLESGHNYGFVHSSRTRHSLLKL